METEDRATMVAATWVPATYRATVLRQPAPKRRHVLLVQGKEALKRLGNQFGEGVL